MTRHYDDHEIACEIRGKVDNQPIPIRALLRWAPFMDELHSHANLGELNPEEEDPGAYNSIPSRPCLTPNHLVPAVRRMKFNDKDAAAALSATSAWYSKANKCGGLLKKHADNAKMRLMVEELLQEDDLLQPKGLKLTPHTLLNKLQAVCPPTTAA